MDTIIDTQQRASGTSTFIPNQQIIFANACRLWLQVSTLSEIVDTDTNKIATWAMYGEAQNKFEGKYPYQPRPPPTAWKEWRMALRQYFLGKSPEQTHDCVLLAPLSKELR